MPVDSVIEYERIWVDGLNRGDASAADEAFRPDCIVHVTGVPEPLRGVGQWKDFIAGHTGPLGPAPATGKRVAVDGLILDRVVGGKVQERWEQFDQSLMLQQLGFA
jgi:hypothetical protein